MRAPFCLPQHFWVFCGSCHCTDGDVMDCVNSGITRAACPIFLEAGGHCVP